MLAVMIVARLGRPVSCRCPHACRSSAPISPTRRRRDPEKVVGLGAFPPGRARGARRWGAGGRGRRVAGDVPQPVGQPGHHRRLVGGVARRTMAFLLGLGTGFLVGGAFLFGLAALVLLFVVTAARSAPMLMVVLGGVVLGPSSPRWSPWTSTSPTPTRRCRPSCSGCSAASPRPPEKVAVAVALIPFGVAVVLLCCVAYQRAPLGDEDARRWASETARWGPPRGVLIVAGAVAVTASSGGSAWSSLTWRGCGSVRTTGPAAGLVPARCRRPHRDRQRRADADRGRDPLGGAHGPGRRARVLPAAATQPRSGVGQCLS